MPEVLPLSLARRVTNLFSRSKIHQDIHDELQAHLGMRSEDNIAAGMTEEDARRDAVLRFGNPSALHEQVVGADAALTMESVAVDVRYGFRQLRRRSRICHHVDSDPGDRDWWLHGNLQRSETPSCSTRCLIPTRARS